MKILCTADFHRSEAIAQKVLDIIKAENIDVYLNCGDFLDNKFAERFFLRLPVKSFIVPGNWDAGLASKSENAVVLSHGIKEYKGYYFLASSSGFPYDVHALMSGTKDIAPEKLIFLTHYPPLGVLDRAWTSHAGYEGYRVFDDARKPFAHIFGHIHEDNGFVKHNGTIFMNASLALTPRAYILEVPEGTVKPVVFGGAVIH